MVSFEEWDLRRCVARHYSAKHVGTQTSNNQNDLRGFKDTVAAIRIMIC
jgi:hypothetical protein